LLSNSNVPVRFRTQQWAKHSSLQLTANCVAAIRCPQYCQTDLRIANQRGHKFPPSVTLPTLPKLQNQNGLQCLQLQVFQAYSFNSCNIQGNISKLLGSQVCSDLKNRLVFSLRFVDFTVQFCFCSNFSFHEKPFESTLTVAWFFWTNHNSWLASNGFFRIRRSGQGLAFE